jgi:hypothetical protein
VADFLHDVAPGQQPGPVLRDSRRVNAWNAAARDFLRSGESGAGAPLDSRLGPQLVVYVRNDTGADLPDFGVVTLSDSLLAGTDAEQSQRDTREQPILKGLLPAADTVIAVTQEPIRKDGIGRATVLGVTPCKLLVNAAGHAAARVIAGDTAKLGSAGDGVPVIYKAATSGETWAVVLLGAGTANGSGLLRGKLDGTQSFQGSAVMSVWAWNGSAEADTGENVTVYDWHLKSGQSIAAGTQVTAAMVGGRWYVIAAQCP